MSESAIRAKIKSVLEGVSGMGTVHDYMRLTKSWDTFLTMFKSGDKINGWHFSRRAIATRQNTIGEKESAHIYQLRGYYGLKDDDASEKTFQALIDAVSAAFDDDETLGDTCDTHPDWGPMTGAVGLQADIIEHRVFGTVLCHFFEGRLCAVETISD